MEILSPFPSHLIEKTLDGLHLFKRLLETFNYLARLALRFAKQISRGGLRITIVGLVAAQWSPAAVGFRGAALLDRLTLRPGSHRGTCRCTSLDWSRDLETSVSL